MLKLLFLLLFFILLLFSGIALSLYRIIRPFINAFKSTSQHQKVSEKKAQEAMEKKGTIKKEEGTYIEFEEIKEP